MKLTVNELELLNRVMAKVIMEKEELFEHTKDREWVLPELQQLESIKETIEQMLLAQ